MVDRRYHKIQIYIGAFVLCLLCGRYKANHSDLRTPLPFCGNPLPPSPWDVVLVWKRWSDNLTISLVYLATLADDGQVITKSVYLWGLIPQQLFWEATEWSVLPGFGLALAFFSMCSWIQNHHHFHPLSSPFVIIIKESHHLFNTRVTVSCFAFLPSRGVVFLNLREFEAKIGMARKVV